MCGGAAFDRLTAHVVISAQRPRPAVFLKLFLLFLTVPLVELAILLILGSKIGWLPTLAIVLFTGVTGAWLAQWQGTQALGRIQKDLSAGQMPTDAVTDAVLIFFAGAMLMTPGVLTDALGFALLIPGGRKLAKRILVRWFKSHFKIEPLRPGPASSGDDNDRVIDSHVVENNAPAEPKSLHE